MKEFFAALGVISLAPALFAAFWWGLTFCEFLKRLKRTVDGLERDLRRVRGELEAFKTRVDAKKFDGPF